MSTRELSGHSINGRDLTWQELYEYEHADRNRLSEFAALLSDLDRCEHGRHEGDTCSGCHGPSHGNPRLSDDRILGYCMNGMPIQYPRRGDGGSVSELNSWLAPTTGLRWCSDCQAWHTPEQRQAMQDRDNAQMASDFNALVGGGKTDAHE